ncbi:MAG: hypothetical protein K9H25_04525 [Rhodospirillum sp.]|nr:hypothetical protein [Rhodospirillum sp.]MCF8488361.1 hypothetical protein [Rhodospirillum sp.]
MASDDDLARLLAKLDDQAITLSLDGDKIVWRAPEGRMTPALMTAMTDVKPRLIEALRGRPAEWVALAPPQRRLYVLMRLDPQRVDLNVSAAVSFTGALDIDALKQALNSLLEDHDALRTEFALRDGRAVQRVMPMVRVPLTVDACDGDKIARDRANLEARKAFTLVGEPTLRALALHYSENAWLVQLTFHHLTCDQGSMRLAVNEVLTRYANAAHGTDLPVNRHPRSFVRFAQAEAERISHFGDRGMAYWSEHLEGLPPRSSPKPGGGPYAVNLSVGPETVARLEKLAERERCTFTAVVMAVFGLVIRHHLGRDDIVIGSPFSSRDAAHGDTVGMFINALAIRLRGAPDAPFDHWLKSVSRNLIAAVEHAHIPYDRVIDTLIPEQRNAELYDAWLAVRQSFEIPAIPGLSVQQLEMNEINANHTLKMEVDRTGLSMSAKLIGVTSAWKPAQMDRLAHRFSAALTVVARAPSDRLDHIWNEVEREAETLSARLKDSKAKRARSSLKAIVHNRA